MQITIRFDNFVIKSRRKCHIQRIEESGFDEIANGALDEWGDKINAVSPEVAVNLNPEIESVNVDLHILSGHERDHTPIR